MAQNNEIVAFLDQLDVYTNDLAQAQAVQTAKIVEIADDIDRLIKGGSGPIDPAVAARLQAASDGLKGVVAFEQAQADTLTQVAAKSENPLP